MSWWALINSWTITGMTPCSRSGAWLAGDRARLRISPMTALIIGQRLGGWSSFTSTGRPPCVRTMFCAMWASAWRLVRWRSAQICHNLSQVWQSARASDQTSTDVNIMVQSLWKWQHVVCHSLTASWWKLLFQESALKFDETAESFLKSLLHACNQN